MFYWLREELCAAESYCCSACSWCVSFLHCKPLLFIQLRDRLGSLLTFELAYSVNSSSPGYRWKMSISFPLGALKVVHRCCYARKNQVRWLSVAACQLKECAVASSTIGVCLKARSLLFVISYLGTTLHLSVLGVEEWDWCANTSS